MPFLTYKNKNHFHSKINLPFKEKVSPFIIPLKPFPEIFSPPPHQPALSYREGELGRVATRLPQVWWFGRRYSPPAS